jgi:3-isopropylmalate/(R)-2-methylmalate dehydratase small subunit
MKAWVFGDDIDTDVLAPGRYMKLGIEEIAKHCLESVSPSFASAVGKGDFVVAGRNFGCGSSREQAPAALKQLGVAALVAESFAGLFYRNSLNLGLPALVCGEAKRIRAGEELEINYKKNEIVNLTTRQAFAFEPIPEHLMEMVRDGGLLPHLEKRLKCRTTS